LLVHTRHTERRIAKKLGVLPIGSRRSRAARSTTENIPFEQLPYQCFQDARQVLAADRQEKVKQIDEMRVKISRVVAMDDAACGGKAKKTIRVDSMKKELERLKVMADINDPIVKKKFEDGQGTTSPTFIFDEQQLIPSRNRRHVLPGLPLPRRTKMA
jgi:large subunit ribosomal protein L35